MQKANDQLTLKIHSSLQFPDELWCIHLCNLVISSVFAPIGIISHTYHRDLLITFSHTTSPSVLECLAWKIYLIRKYQLTFIALGSGGLQWSIYVEDSKTAVHFCCQMWYAQCLAICILIFGSMHGHFIHPTKVSRIMVWQGFVRPYISLLTYGSLLKLPLAGLTSISLMSFILCARFMTLVMAPAAH